MVRTITDRLKAAALALAACLALGPGGAPRAAAADLDAAALDRIRAIAGAQVERRRLNSLLLQVRLDGREAITLALGEAMAGVPATPQARFRNGAVAIAYVAALALRLAEEGIVDLDAPIARWLPGLPGADRATIRMLANMTAGYPDHAADEEKFVKPLLADPFRTWTAQEMIDISLSSPRPFAPGRNWDYSHSGYVVLGRVLEAATSKPLRALMQDYVLTPLKLEGTFAFDDATIPPPAIHAFTAERGIWEDSTFWNPSWTLPPGAVQVSTISDMARSFDAIVGADGFLSAASRKAMIEPRLVGFGAPLDGCRTCREMTARFNYGLGVMRRGAWLVQTPSFAGYASAVATLPRDASRLTLAVAVTMTRASNADWSGRLPNHADETLGLIAAALAPEAPIP